MTVIDSKNLSSEQLIEQVKYELKNYCGIETVRMIKEFAVPKALPKLVNLKYEILPFDTLYITIRQLNKRQNKWHMYHRKIRQN